jgi:DNA-binding HxlR family transcriptional regulator
MLRRDYSTQNCSVARTLEVIGERWSILIIRNAFYGIRRFDEHERWLGIARNVLQTRLELLVDQGILSKELYQERPPRHEYRLTQKGIDLWPVLVTMLQWGDRYEAKGKPPLVLLHRDCGGEVDPHLRCDKCGADLTARDVEPSKGPGLLPGQTTPRVPAASG